MTISAEVDERALREIHLVAFEAAVREAGVWSVMTAYNKVNGDLLRRAAGPDRRASCAASGASTGWSCRTGSARTRTAPAARGRASTSRCRGPRPGSGPTLAAAVRDGRGRRGRRRRAGAPRAAADGPGGLLDGDAAGVRGGREEREEDDPGRRAVARQVAAEGTVLLVNDGLLPLDPAGPSRAWP